MLGESAVSPEFSRAMRDITSYIWGMSIFSLLLVQLLCGVCRRFAQLDKDSCAWDSLRSVASSRVPSLLDFRSFSGQSTIDCFVLFSFTFLDFWIVLFVESQTTRRVKL